MKIFALSRCNQDVFSKLADKSETLIDHLIKVFLYPNAFEVSHWKQEVWTTLNRVPKLKSNNKFPTYQQIMKSIWNSYEDIIPNLVDLWISEINEIPMKLSYENIHSAIHQYMNWAAYELSTKGIVTSKSVYKIIESIQSILYNKEST